MAGISGLGGSFQMEWVAALAWNGWQICSGICSFEDDPQLIFADLHEDGRFLYPGTGAETETGKGDAQGTKLNIPMPPQAGDKDFFKAWASVEEFLLHHRADFILLQCGADSIKGDPITHMEYSEQAHAYAAKRLCDIANEMCGGKLIAMGGGGIITIICNFSLITGN